MKCSNCFFLQFFLPHKDRSEGQQRDGQRQCLHCEITEHYTCSFFYYIQIKCIPIYIFKYKFYITVFFIQIFTSRVEGGFVLHAHIFVLNSCFIRWNFIFTNNLFIQVFTSHAECVFFFTRMCFYFYFVMNLCFMHWSFIYLYTHNFIELLFNALKFYFHEQFFVLNSFFMHWNFIFKRTIFCIKFLFHVLKCCFIA